MKKAKPFIIIFLIIVTLTLLDQVLKMVIPKDEIILIPGLLKITYSENTGGAFSIGSGNIGPIIIINVIILIFIFRFLFMNINKASKISIFSLCLISAGGISNLINRIFLGYVIDYINVGDLIKFPIFNLADIFIVIRMDYIYHYNSSLFNKNEKIRRIYERYNYNSWCAN